MEIFRVKIVKQNPSFWYNLNDEFIVKDVTGKHYLVNEGEHQGEIIWKDDCIKIYSPEAIHRASILKPENIEGCKDRIKTWKSDLLLMEAKVYNLKKEIQVEEEAVEILGRIIADKTENK